MNATCSIAGCDYPVRARTYCGTHYRRWRETGSSGPAERLRGPRGVCKVPDCGLPHRAQGYCGTHYMRLHRLANPKPPRTRIERPRSETWRAIHHRLESTRGKARHQPCNHCDRDALHWAYDNADPNVQYDGKSGMPFSMDLSHYIALCPSCHKRFDLQVGETA